MLTSASQYKCVTVPSDADVTVAPAPARSGDAQRHMRWVDPIYLAEWASTIYRLANGGRVPAGMANLAADRCVNAEALVPSGATGPSPFAHVDDGGASVLGTLCGSMNTSSSRVWYLYLNWLRPDVAVTEPENPVEVSSDSEPEISDEVLGLASSNTSDYYLTGGIPAACLSASASFSGFFGDSSDRRRLTLAGVLALFESCAMFSRFAVFGMGSTLEGSSGHKTQWNETYTTSGYPDWETDYGSHGWNGPVEGISCSWDESTSPSEGIDVYNHDGSATLDPESVPTVSSPYSATTTTTDVTASTGELLRLSYSAGVDRDTRRNFSGTYTTGSCTMSGCTPDGYEGANCVCLGCSVRGHKEWMTWVSEHDGSVTAEYLKTPKLTLYIGATTTNPQGYALAGGGLGTNYAAAFTAAVLVVKVKATVEQGIVDETIDDISSCMQTSGYDSSTRYTWSPPLAAVGSIETSYAVPVSDLLSNLRVDGDYVKVDVDVDTLLSRALSAAGVPEAGLIDGTHTVAKMASGATAPAFLNAPWRGYAAYDALFGLAKDLGSGAKVPYIDGVADENPAEECYSGEGWDYELDSIADPSVSISVTVGRFVGVASWNPPVRV